MMERVWRPLDMFSIAKWNIRDQIGRASGHLVFNQAGKRNVHARRDALQSS